jgi:hypothetical protein
MTEGDARGKGSGSNPYHVRLEDITPPPEERTTSVEYVADRLKKKPNPFTIEGMIDGIGQLSSAAVEDPDSPRGRSARVMVLWLLVPFLVAGFFELFGVLRLL